jgi:hypothetical protein|eukprot:COSAG06_NODE_6038_length_3139_cov_63.365132_1_plen_56_part_00
MGNALAKSGGVSRRLNFSPLESHGVTIQEGDDGNTDGTYIYIYICAQLIYRPLGP